MTHLRRTTFFDSYDAQDAKAMQAWAQHCLKSHPQMLVDVFCGCVEDPDEYRAVDFMLEQISNDEQWLLAVHLFKGKKGDYFSRLLPKLCDEHSHFSFSCLDYILIEGVDTQNIPLLRAVIPHLTKSLCCDWEQAYAPQDVNSAWETAMDKAVEKGWFEVVKTLLPYAPEDARFIPALTAVEWQRKDYLDYIFENSSFDLSVSVALHSIRMQKCRNMTRYILKNYPQIAASEIFLTGIQNFEDDEHRQWFEKYLAQKQRSKLSSAVRDMSSVNLSLARKM